MPVTHRPEVVVDGLKYAEGLRWHDDRLWFSDMLDDRVCTWNGSDGLRTEFVVEEPSGLGFLPDGRVLIVGRAAGKILSAFPGSAPQPFSELDGVIGVNDLVTDTNGFSYVGSLGKKYELGDEHRAWHDKAPGKLLLIDPDGEATVAATGLACPNGMIITPDGATLVVAETYTARLVAFRRNRDGSLFERRIVGDLRPGIADGLTYDAEGCFWVGAGDSFVKVDAAGNVTDQIEVPGYRCIACMLGGPQRKTLFLAVCKMEMESFLERQSVGQILVCDVEVPGAGLP